MAYLPFYEVNLGIFDKIQHALFVQGVQNGSCVDLSSDSENFASFGRCSEFDISLDKDLEFAPDYCPSDLGEE